MNTKKDINFPIGFTAIDNRLFYTQEVLSPNAFSVLVRIYRMSNGYDGKPKSLSSTFFQKYCCISKNTVTKVVKELESKGFINTHKRSRSNTLYSINMENINKQYLSTVNESQELLEVDTNDVNELAQEMCSNKQNPLKQNNTKENINIPFSDFWNKYDYAKGQKSSVEAKWLSLTDEERALTMQSLDKYLLSTPDKTYRKYPMTYLNTEAWNDEIVIPTDTQASTGTYNSHYNSQNQAYSASFKPFDTKVVNDTQDGLESKLEGVSIDSNSGLDSIKDVLAQSSQVHWSELKAKGLLKKQVNPSAVTVSESKQQEIDDFLARNSSRRFKQGKSAVAQF